MTFTYPILRDTKKLNTKPSKPKINPPKKIKNVSPALRGKACPKGHTVCGCH